MPEPGGAGDEDDPALLLGQRAHHLGQAEVVDRADLEGDRAADDRDRAALLEGVDAEARDVRQRVGEVGLAFLLEFGQRADLGDVVQRLLGVGVSELAEPLERDQLAVHAGDRRRADLEVQVGPLPLDEGTQC